MTAGLGCSAGGHREAQAAPDQPPASLGHVRTEETKALRATGEASGGLRLIHAPAEEAGEQGRALGSCG